MAPKWLSFSDDGNKRSSVRSSMTSSNRQPVQVETSQAFPDFAQPVYPQVQSSFDFEPDHKESWSRKRLSYFARNNAVDNDDVGQRPQTSKSTERKPLEKPTSTPAGGDARRTSRFYRNRFTKYHKNALPIHENVISRWIRGDDRNPRQSMSNDVPEDMDSEEAFYRNLKKSTISTPFNFQHITHTQQNELPKLEFADDRELMLGFWAASAQQYPQESLRGIKAENIEEQQRRARAGSQANSSPASPSKFMFTHGPLSGRAHNSRDGSRPQTSGSPRVDSPHSTYRPSTDQRSLSQTSQGSGTWSSPSAIHPALRNQDEWLQQDFTGYDGAESAAPSDTPMSKYSNNLDAVPEELEAKSAQNSPSKERNVTRGSIVSQFQGSPQPAPDVPALDYSFGTASLSEWQSSTEVSRPKTSIPSLGSGDSWEDDIDLAYFMEAESTCDFDWDSRNNSMIQGRDSGLMSPPKDTLARQDIVSDVSPRVSIARHQRAKSSMTLTNLPSFTDVETRSEIPTTSLYHLKTPQAFLPELPSISPMFETWASTPSPMRSPKSRPKTFHSAQRSLDNKGSINVLADQSKPSSSIFAGFARGHFRSISLPTTDQFNNSAPSKRWSSFMPSRIPESARSRPTSVMTSSQLKALPTFEYPRQPPQIPLPAIPIEAQRSETVMSTPLPAPIIPFAEDPHVIRRPQTPQDRFLLQAAGKTVQKGRVARPGTASRLSQVQRSATSEGLADIMARSASTTAVNLTGLPSEQARPHFSPQMGGADFPQWI